MRAPARLQAHGVPETGNNSANGRKQAANGHNLWRVAAGYYRLLNCVDGGGRMKIIQLL